MDAADLGADLIVLTAGPIAVRIGNRSYDPLRSASLYGITSRAMPTTANGGTTVVVDVSPLGRSARPTMRAT